jgi:hypothetical protein
VIEPLLETVQTLLAEENALFVLVYFSRSSLVDNILAQQLEKRKFVFQKTILQQTLEESDALLYQCTKSNVVGQYLH